MIIKPEKQDSMNGEFSFKLKLFCLFLLGLVFLAACRPDKQDKQSPVMRAQKVVIERHCSADFPFIKTLNVLDKGAVRIQSELISTKYFEIEFQKCPLPILSNAVIYSRYYNEMAEDVHYTESTFTSSKGHKVNLTGAWSSESKRGNLFAVVADNTKACLLYLHSWDQDLSDQEKQKLDQTFIGILNSVEMSMVSNVNGVKS